MLPLEHAGPPRRTHRAQEARNARPRTTQRRLRASPRGRCDRRLVSADGGPLHVQDGSRTDRGPSPPGEMRGAARSGRPAARPPRCRRDVVRARRRAHDPRGRRTLRGRTRRFRPRAQGRPAHLPRHVRVGRVLVSFAPAGTQGPSGAGLEGFFREIGIPAVPGEPQPEPVTPDPEDFARRAAQYGIEILGPPPTLD
jgi:hypothetical protein